MTEQQIKFYRKAADEGTITDDQNPLYLFALTHPGILAAITRGEYDMRRLAAYELAIRGLSPEGKWVGFREAEHLRQQLFKRVRQSKRKGL